MARSANNATNVAKGSPRHPDFCPTEPPSLPAITTPSFLIPRFNVAKLACPPLESGIVLTQRPSLLASLLVVHPFRSSRTRPSVVTFISSLSSPRLGPKADKRRAHIYRSHLGPGVSRTDRYLTTHPHLQAFLSLPYAGLALTKSRIEASSKDPRPSEEHHSVRATP